MTSNILLTITDEKEYAQAFVIIEAIKNKGIKMNAILMLLIIIVIIYLLIKEKMTEVFKTFLLLF